MADLTVQLIDTVSVGIEWTFGLIEADAGDMELWRTLSEEPGKDPVYGSHMPQTWGMFKLSEDKSPEPLWGHVTSLHWLPATETTIPQRPANEKLVQVREDWIKSFTTLRKEKGEAWMNRSAVAIAAEAMSIAEWHDKHEESPHNLGVRLDRAQEIIQQLDEALHSEEGPFTGERYSLWEHRPLGEIYRTTKPFHRENFMDLSTLGNIVTDYLAKPWLQSLFLDWLLLDAMTSGKIVGTLELYMKEKHGMAYALFDGVTWKMFLWKLVLKPLTFLLGWALPAAICYLLARWSLPVAIAVGVIWYGVNLLVLLRWLWSKLSHLFTGKQTHLQEMTQLIGKMEEAYKWLAGPVLHVGTIRAAFERAAARGVIWDQQIFYILDRLAQQNPQIWDNRVRQRY